MVHERLVDADPVTLTDFVRSVLNLICFLLLTWDVLFVKLTNAYLVA